MTGRREFLYVANYKLATVENMAYIHRHGGRFLSVLPGTRGEDAAFRAEILSGRAQWRRIHDKYEDQGELVVRFSIHESELASVEGCIASSGLTAPARPSWMPLPGTKSRLARELGAVTIRLIE